MKLLALLTLVAELTAVAAYKMPPLDPKLAKIAVGKRNKVDIVETFSALKTTLQKHRTDKNQKTLDWITEADADAEMNVRRDREEFLREYREELDRVKGRVPRGMFSHQPQSKLVPTTVAPPSRVRHSIEKKKWGVEDPRDYWFDKRIHTFGNTGFTGGVHAVCAPIATALIDNLAYDGRSVREEIAVELKNRVGGGNKNVLDMCCGVGISTRALAKSFNEDESVVVGLDTSPEMLAMAKMQTTYSSFKSTFNHALEALPESTSNLLSFVRGNAEKMLFKKGTFDLVTIMYAFHEAPRAGRYKMLREVRRVLKPGGKLAIIDISPEYTPSASMLAGEPYVIEYQKNIHQQMEKIRGFVDLEYKVIVPGHVGMWLLQRKEEYVLATE
ncbi:hypothetical protein TrST_g3717 [Triparma strigata]|uniref:Methyltransferase type 11 domain-containing protein n=1 Tax=Triparma strigata TaxID=1606541 RepID=A0A9W6ZPD6_9STRA|nr:hypothetical protein TrST_g3717 [Triparma strigata]